MSRVYLVVNSDLEMSAGKIAAQVGHAVQHIFEYYIDHVDKQSDLIKYQQTGNTKIVLKASHDKIIALYRKYPNKSFLIIDAGRTEIEPGSVTVLGFLPMSEPLKELKSLSLL